MIETLAARQLGSLRRHGLSVLDALSLVTPSLPDGPARRGCQEAQAALSQGRTDGKVEHPLGAVAARGDGATAEVFEALARAYDARDVAEHTLRWSSRLLTGFVVAPLLVYSVLGWLVPGRVLSLDTAYFAPGGWPSLSLPHLGRYLGPPLALVAWLGMRRVGRRLSPGSRELALRSRLLQFAATADEAAQFPPTQDLSPPEKVFVGWRTPMVGGRQTASELAEELGHEGTRKVRAFAQTAPAAGAIVLLVLSLIAGVAAALPVFASYVRLFAISK